MSDKEKKPKRPLKGKVFQCTGFPNCNKSFTRSEHLARHRRKHTGERPFTCPHCSKNFSRLDNLRQHKQTVHAYENYIKKRPLGQLARPEGSEILPGTPLQFGPKLFSPPSLGSPLTALVYYEYYDPEDARHGSHPQNVSGNLPPIHLLSHYRTSSQNHSNVKGSSGDEKVNLLREVPKFNPKNRPKPLALAHSFADDNVINNRTQTPAFTVEPPLKTAPPMSLFTSYSPSATHIRHGLAYDMGNRFGYGVGLPHSYGSGVGYSRGVGSVLGLMFQHFNPMMVSPLLPLFHQLFNQIPPSSSTFFPLQSLSRVSSELALVLNVLLPSISRISTNKDDNEDDVMEGNKEKTAIENSASGVTVKAEEKIGEDKKVGLNNMLNEEPKKLAIDSLITPGEEETEPMKEK